MTTPATYARRHGKSIAGQVDRQPPDAMRRADTVTQGTGRALYREEPSTMTDNAVSCRRGSAATGA